MKEDFLKVLEQTHNMDEACNEVLHFLKYLHEDKKVERIGFVSGVLFSNGDVKENLKRLKECELLLQKKYKFPIFSDLDVTHNELFEKYPESKLPSPFRRQKFFLFWRRILASGYITDIYMTPKWDTSEGATDEYKTAQEFGIAVHYVNSNGTLH